MPSRKQLEQQYIEDRAFFGSVSSRWRGLAGGILIGGVMGAAVGLAGTAIFSAVSGIAMAELGKGAILAAVAFFSGTGMLTGMNLWGGAGQVAGAVAAGLTAQKELDPVQGKVLNQQIDIPGAPAPGKPKLLNWKLMAIGAAISGSAGAFLAYNGALPAGAAYTLLGQPLGTASGALAAGSIMAAFGAAFGVGFQVWQGVKQWTDGLFESRASGRSTPAQEPLKELLVSNQPQLTEEASLAVEPKKLVAQGPLSQKILRRTDEAVVEKHFSI